MRGIPPAFLVLFFAIVFLIELISYFGIHQLTKNWNIKNQKFVRAIYLLISLSVFGIIAYAFSNPELIRQSHNYNLFFVVITLSFLNLFPKSLFSFFTLLSFLVNWFAGKRSQLIILSGSFLISTGIFLGVTYAVFLGRYDIRVEKQDLYLADFPEQLNGLKIVQLSDIHLGSFGENQKTMNRTVQIINQIQPDILLFTGDLVNNFADEISGFEEQLQKLKARYGKFAISGNHDYGDYSNWPDSLSKVKNLEELRAGLINSGFRLLLNEWEQVQIQDTSICIAGVENWGHPPFPQYAHLDSATSGIPEGSFTILMTHDPAHWKAKVVPDSDIPLSLSGHTHGGQFGFRIAGIEFSPIYLHQKLWGGLYQAENQYLYVNRGLGTVGFPGRLDMRPEITLLTLYRKKIN